MLRFRWIAIVFLLCFSAQTSFAGKISTGKFNNRPSFWDKSLSEFKNASLKNIRLIQEKQSQEMAAEEINSLHRARSVKPKPAESPAEAAVSVESVSFALAEQASLKLQAASNPEADLIYGELIHNQQASPLGLVVSYTGQRGLENQGFTYDQAAAGIAMLKQGDTASAGKILDFFKAEWDGTGFATVYNTQVAGGWAIEDDKILGPNAWVALFALQYHAKTGDAAALDLATQIAKWAMTLPHTSGGAAMGEDKTEWAERYSVENNLSYYAALQLLSTEAGGQADRDAFSGERDRLKQWLQFPGFAPSEGLFRRGAYLDSLKALDTNSWGVLVLGVSGLQEIGVDVNVLVSNIEKEFLVNDTAGIGSYGADAFSSKGFDFSSSTNGFLTYGRPTVKWVEGTNQMITVYRVLADYYENGPAPDPVRAAGYAAKADYFSGLNAAQQVTTAGGSSYAYADALDAQVFFDIPGWRTAGGPSVAAAVWVYYSLYGFNPFEKIAS